MDVIADRLLEDFRAEMRRSREDMRRFMDEHFSVVRQDLAALKEQYESGHSTGSRDNVIPKSVMNRDGLAPRLPGDAPKGSEPVNEEEAAKRREATVSTMQRHAAARIMQRHMRRHRWFEVTSAAKDRDKSLRHIFDTACKGAKDLDEDPFLDCLQQAHPSLSPQQRAVLWNGFILGTDKGTIDFRGFK